MGGSALREMSCQSQHFELCQCEVSNSRSAPTREIAPPYKREPIGAGGSHNRCAGPEEIVRRSHGVFPEARSSGRWWQPDPVSASSCANQQWAF